jgi:stearoyl-CoA desaturase (delta-9 desaturase)
MELCSWYCCFALVLQIPIILAVKKHIRKDLLVGRAIFFSTVHVIAVLGAYLASVHESAACLWLEAIVMWQIGGFGITVGAHRLWSHRSYVAKMPLRILLMLLNSFANQGTIYHWARDHRAHHKYTDTPADPHDTNRGFFFAHIGWLLVPKHPDIKAKGDAIPCGDLLADPVVAFQKKAEDKVMFNELVSLGLPALYGSVMYNDAWLGFLVHGVLRWILCLHATWCVNSAAHWFGENSYDLAASPRESWFTSIVAVGEGWHSYHHKYPWDYATSEFGISKQWNPSKAFIDLMVVLGQASNLKRAINVLERTRQSQNAQKAQDSADTSGENTKKLESVEGPGKIVWDKDEAAKIAVMGA